MSAVKFFVLAVLLILIGGSSSLFAEAMVKGRVIFQGTAPQPEKVEVKSDVPTCGTEREVRKIVMGESQGVAQAVVRIVGVTGSPEPKSGKLDQINCEFVPHVQVLTQGSSLNITSSDPVLHNAHGFYEDGSTAFNLAVPFAGLEIPVTLDKTGVIKLRCDAGHTWMSAYIVVLDTPYFALTDENGNFSISGVPAGDYEIEVWHEWLGIHREKVAVKEGEQSVQITMEKS